MTPATFHILIALTAGAKHGCAIKRHVESVTRGAVRLGAGTLYAALQRLEREGSLCETEPPEAGATNASSRWRFYCITEVGQRRLAQELRRLEADLQIARTVIAAAEGTPRRILGGTSG